MLRRLLLASAGCLALLAAGDHAGLAQNKKEAIPHGQSQAPGPPLTPVEAIKKMQVPPGFHVELVAAEPNLVNPIAMTFDEKGRIWVTESIEYPRHSAGPGKDRVKVLESTKADGHYDKVTTVIEGLNIPSGIAVGHGGVWVANSPDLLFYPFVDRDAPKLGPPQVVVTGFGRADTHELPNSLTWGPDGYLYGLNGVFNPSVVKQDGKEWRFTCALFRIHPKTKKFDLFCEGTSNPWGVAFNENGDAFVSACVIDHLWHLVQTGYYHRQGGAYPPFAWKIESIVKHRHQQAAYCGLVWFDSDAYPPEYRGKLFMGNIHGNCINSDELTRDGSTYFGKPRPDFLTANDAWFMPVAQKVGPDGCLYILDWYDRYHCYQDAGRDPAGIDRLRGRLYRVVYHDYKPAGPIDLQRETDEQLIKRLHSANGFIRETAQRLLTERCRHYLENWSPTAAAYRAFGTAAELQQLVLNEAAPRTARKHALWALVGSATTDKAFQLAVLGHKDAALRAWGVRAASDRARSVPPEGTVGERIVALAGDPSPDVKLQVAIAARRVKGADPMQLLMRVLAECGHDRLIPHIVWQNLHPLLEDHAAEFVKHVTATDLRKAPGLAKVLPRAVERILAAKKLQPDAIVGLVNAPAVSADPSTCAQCLAALAQHVQSGELAGANLEALHAKLQGFLNDRAGQPGAIGTEAALLAATLKEPAGLSTAHKLFADAQQNEGTRLKALAALVTGGDPAVLDDAARVLGAAHVSSVKFRGQVIAALGKLQEPKVAAVVLAQYAKMEPELQPRAIDLLTERSVWSKQLLAQIGNKRIPSSALNVNQVKKLLASKDPALIKQVTAVWGTLREDRNPEREKIVADMRQLLTQTPGDAHRGVAVFKKVCAQCHKIYGEGVDVGPDITSNGRSDFNQLLSNVFDPSLVIGAGYQATTVVTNAGQVLTGLVVEDSPQRVVLKVQGGELKTVPRGSIDEVRGSKVSLMPEGLERQLQPQELADLFAFLSLDRPPADPKARKIPGTPR